MIYLKKVYFQNTDWGHVETALRSNALRHPTSLDYTFTAVDFATEKQFFGVESDEDLKLTRVKTSFEQLLPKLIIVCPKGDATGCYKIRISALSTIVFFLLSFGVIAGITSFARGNASISEMVPFLVFFNAYLLFLVLELRMTTSKLSKVLSACNNATIG